MSSPAFDYYSQKLEQRIILRLAEEKGVDIKIKVKEDEPKDAE